jgi:putative tricarboxylic transport membrane protein
LQKPWANGPEGGWKPNFNTALAGGCILFSIFLFLIIPYQVEEQPTLFGVTGSGLDPAFFPNLVAILFLVIGAIYLWLSFGMTEHNGFRDLTGNSYATIGISLGIFILYAALLQPLGFLLSSGLVVAALSVFYGARHIPSILLVAVGVPAAVYFVFRRALNVALPEFPDF